MLLLTFLRLISFATSILEPSRKGPSLLLLWLFEESVVPFFFNFRSVKRKEEPPAWL